MPIKCFLRSLDILGTGNTLARITGWNGLRCDCPAPWCGGKFPAQLLAHLPLLSHHCSDKRPHGLTPWKPSLHLLWLSGWWHMAGGNTSGLWSAPVTVVALGLCPLPMGLSTQEPSWVMDSAGGAVSWQGFLPDPLCPSPRLLCGISMGCGGSGSTWGWLSRSWNMELCCSCFPWHYWRESIIFPTPTENAKSKEFLNKIASLLNPICLPPPHLTAPAADREIQSRVIKLCGQ